MSHLNIQVGNITPLVKNGNAISLASVQLLVTGELSGKGQDPYSNDAVLAAVAFPKAFAQQPVSAWIGNFEGGDFAEVLWSITNLSAEGFILFASNQDFRSRFPHGANGALVINVTVAFAAAEAPAKAAAPKAAAEVKAAAEAKPAKAAAPKAEAKPKAAKAAKPAAKKA